MVPSAFINTPPASHRDYMIAKGILLNAGITNDIRDPSKGVKLSPARPEDYSFETKGPQIIAGLSICIAGMTIVTCLRLGLRLFVPRLRWGLDDSIMVVGLLLAVAYPSLQIAMVQYGGAGKHIFDVTYQEYYHYKWLANIAQIDFFVCVGVVKMSIACFNLRLTSLSSRKWQIVNWSFFGACAGYVLTAFFLNIFQCSPAGGSFDLLILARSGVPPKCVGVAHMNTILRAINITLDYCLLAVPVVILWKVRMSWMMKGRLFIMFGVGGLACVGSVMTLVSKFHLKTDFLWNYTGILGWSLVELSLGVLAASLPTLAFLLPKSMKSNPYQYPTAEVRVSHTPSGYDPSRKINTETSFGSLKRHSKLQEELVGIVRTREVELDRRPNSDTGSQDPVIDQEGTHHDTGHEDPDVSDDENVLPIMSHEGSPVTNFSRPTSKV